MTSFVKWSALFSCLVILSLTRSAWTITRHVPVEYPTIQSALDALMEGDTVLVDTGLYEEALLAPWILYFEETSLRTRVIMRSPLLIRRLSPIPLTGAVCDRFRAIQ